MTGDVEETLTRELREVAHHLHVPAMPALPRERPRRPWQPLLVAAAVLLVVAGGVAAVTTRGDTPEPAPAPAPSPPSATASAAAVPRTPPRVPFVLDQRLFVDGAQVPGTWWSVQAGADGWLALRTDNTWWWGSGPQAHAIPGPHDTPPVISPDGKYIAQTTVENGRGMVTGFDTRPAGEGFGGVPVDLGDRQDGSLVTVRAVTDDGKVIVQGSRTALLWLPLLVDAGDPVDLTATTPGVQVLDSTPAGLVVTYGSDSTDGQPFLAEISDSGELTRKESVPAHDTVSVSPGGAWLVWTPPGSLGGEVAALPTLEAQPLDGSSQVTLAAPEGWAFRVSQWGWEDDEHLVSPVTADSGGRRDRMARCSVVSVRCVLIRTR